MALTAFIQDGLLVAVLAPAGLDEAVLLVFEGEFSLGEVLVHGGSELDDHESVEGLLFVEVLDDDIEHAHYVEAGEGDVVAFEVLFPVSFGLADVGGGHVVSLFEA